MSITPKQNLIFLPNLTRKIFGWIVPLGGAIIMKLPLTIIGYYDKKFYILGMHWCTISKLCVFH